jgi:ADP-ribose pyrophosphatase
VDESASDTHSLTAKTYPTAPRLAVGAVVIHRRQVLLVCRRDPPNAGQWAIPGGSVRLGESLAAAAQREIREETGILVRAGRPVYVFESIEHDALGAVRFHYVIVDLLAEYLSGEPRPQDDAVDARWVAPNELARLPVNATTLDLLCNTLAFGA